MKNLKKFSTFVRENFEQPGWSSNDEVKPTQRMGSTHFHDEEEKLSDEEQLYRYWLDEIENEDYYDEDDDFTDED
jgi:hypothetical protein